MNARPFDIGDKVIADGDDTLKMIVTAYTQRGRNYRMVECSYFCDGSSKAAWVEDWRLTAVGQP